MKYKATTLSICTFFGLMLLNTLCVGMHNDSPDKPFLTFSNYTAYIRHIIGRVREEIDQDLLIIAQNKHKNIYDTQQFYEELKKFYDNRPGSQRSVYAYVSKPAINTIKISAYIQFLLTTSNYMRANIQPNGQKVLPTNRSVLTITSENWPVVSLGYDFQLSASHVAQIYTRGRELLPQEKIHLLQPVAEVHDALSNAAKICQSFQFRIKQ